MPIPEWDSIKIITEDLKNVLDNFVDDGTPIPVMRVRLARAIAEMRAEKGIEERRKSAAIHDPYHAIREMTNNVRKRL
ncbi:MAG: hypothetical protein ACTSRA_18450, partial [Promethearchaeota archaeon]